MNSFRKITAFVMAVSYMVLSVGFTLQAHYCHGNLSSISYVSEGSQCQCDTIEEVSCCASITQYVKLDENSRMVNKNIVYPTYVGSDFALIFDIQSNKVDFVPNTLEGHTVFLPKYILNSSLVLYA